MSGIGGKLKALWSTGPGATSSPRSEKKNLPKKVKCLSVNPNDQCPKMGQHPKLAIGSW